MQYNTIVRVGQNRAYNANNFCQEGIPKNHKILDVFIQKFHLIWNLNEKNIFSLSVMIGPIKEKNPKEFNGEYPISSFLLPSYKKTMHIT